MGIISTISHSGNTTSFPTRSVNSLHEEIKCYSLPYGALGFVSHLLTYWALGCLWKGVRPLWPSRKASYTGFDFLLGFISLITTITMSIITLVKCRNTWQLLVIGVWKLSMSLLNGLTVLHVASNIGKQTPGWRMTWLTFYLPGMFAGFAGLMSLVSQHIHQHKGVLKITIAFYIIVGVFTIGGVLGHCDSNRPNPDADDEPRTPDNATRGKDTKFELFMIWLMDTCVIFVALSAFYADWTLGMMADNISGFPSKDNTVFYWCYYAAKRLTLFTW